MLRWLRPTTPALRSVTGALACVLLLLWGGAELAHDRLHRRAGASEPTLHAAGRAVGHTCALCDWEGVGVGLPEPPPAPAALWIPQSRTPAPRGLTALRTPTAPTRTGRAPPA